MRIAIIGSGISGLVSAHLLHERHDVVLYEADGRPGGHSHTHSVQLDDAALEVDTGFLVYNERTYPLFAGSSNGSRWATKPSDMSFSVADARTGIEWRGSSASSVFAQRRNLVRRDFLADARRHRTGQSPRLGLAPRAAWGRVNSRRRSHRTTSRRAFGTGTSSRSGRRSGPPGRGASRRSPR